jgi:hypothetical protein
MQAFNNETFETEETDMPALALLPAGKRRKRTEAEMIAAQGSALAQASYVTQRLAKLEEKMAELLAAVPAEARDLIISQPAHSHLRRYLP